MDKVMTLVDHLEELRKRIITSLVWIALLTALAFPLAPRILAVLKSPARGVIERLVFFDPPEALLIHIKLSFLTGLIASMPVIFYQLWAFISPAMEEKMRRYGLIFGISSATAFICGGLFGFFLLLPAALNFLLNFAKDSLEPVISVSKYTSFAMTLVLGCGLVFEMPVLSYLLSKAGIISPRFLRGKWKYAVIVIFIIAALVTPTPDIFGMTILAIPMLLLYELSIWVSKFACRAI
jgi:sec-independent protein translocase protein TatC